MVQDSGLICRSQTTRLKVVRVIGGYGVTVLLGPS